MEPLAGEPGVRQEPLKPLERLPLLQDGRLSLELLARYAAEYDDHGEGVTYPAAAFVEFLRLEASARLMRVPRGLVKHALAPKTGQPRGRPRRSL